MSSHRDPARTRRRDLAKRHHPDVGGDPAEFVRAFHGPGPHQRHSEQIVITTSVRSLISRRARRFTTTAVSAVRRRLPQSFPGARRDGQL